MVLPANLARKAGLPSSPEIGDVALWQRNDNDEWSFKKIASAIERGFLKAQRKRSAKKRSK